MTYPLFYRSLGISTFFITVALLVISPTNGSVVEINQSALSNGSDLLSGDSNGQTFTAQSDRTLLGVRLMAQAKGWAGDYPTGTAAAVRLRAMGTDGFPVMSPLAEGLIPRSDVPEDALEWVTVLFDQPYQQTPGEVLSFMIEGLSGGGSEGWNDYGVARGNPYPGGQKFALYSLYPGAPLQIQFSSDTDFTFQTLVQPVPEPVTAWLYLAPTILLRRSRG